MKLILKMLVRKVDLFRMEPDFFSQRKSLPYTSKNHYNWKNKIFIKNTIKK